MKDHLISYEIFQDILFNRATAEYADSIWELLSSGKIKGYLTETGLDMLYIYLERWVGVEKAEEIIHKQIKELVEICPVDPVTILEASDLSIKFDYAIEIVCAKQKKIKIVTLRTDDFRDLKNSCISIDELLTHYCSEKSKSNLNMGEIKTNLEKIYYQQDNHVQLCLFPPEKDKNKHPMAYNIRNNIDAVMTVFNRIKTQESKGISYEELRLKINLRDPRKTIDSIILDLIHFQLAFKKNEKIFVMPYLLNYDQNQIAEHIAIQLVKHIRVQNIYKKTRPCEIYSKKYIKSLAYPEETKSSKDYFSRLLSWLYFTGLLNEIGKNKFTRSPQRKPQKKLKQDIKIEQLELPIFVNS
jgi:hypothetical protein